MVVFTIIFIVLNVIGLIVGNYFYSIAINKNNTAPYLKDYYQKEVSAGSFDTERFNKLQKEDVTIRSQYNYDLKGTYIFNSKATENTVICVHGIGQDRWTMMKYADMYLDEGFNVMVYDSRNHGKSGGDKISYGYFEQDDLEKVVQYIKNKNPGGILGIQGESMGSATVLMQAEKYNKSNEVDFYVEDCGYSNLYSLFVTRLEKDYHLPNLLIVDYASFISKLRAGFSFKDVSPLSNIDKVTAPILFIHGDSDNFVPIQMIYDLYAKKKGIKELYIVKGAGHAESLTRDKEKYKETVSNFLKKVLN